MGGSLGGDWAGEISWARGFAGEIARLHRPQKSPHNSCCSNARRPQGPACSVRVVRSLLLVSRPACRVAESIPGLWYVRK